MNLLFLGTPEDETYLVHLKPILAGHQCAISMKSITTWLEVKMVCQKKGITGIVSTSPALLKKLVPASANVTISIDNYAGSFFQRDGIEIVFVNPLKQMFTVSYGKFLLRRYISKITGKAIWNRLPATKFDWAMLDATNADAAFLQLQGAIAIAVDIETRPDLSISMISYTGIFRGRTNFETMTYVLPINTSYELAVMRRFNWELQPPKIFQNGKYDNAYLLAYNAPIYNWLYDTITMMHSWYSELPKDLAFQGAFFIRECIYWKDMAQSGDMKEQYEYNARDTWNTANIFLQWLLLAPQWAKDNYLMEFPLNYPCLLSEMTGIKRDLTRLKEIRAAGKLKIEQMSKQLDTMLGVKNFNVASSPQMIALFKLLGCGDLPKRDEKNIKKAMFRHPLNVRILDLVLAIRAHRKMLSTYLRTDEDIKKNGDTGAKEFKGRVLYDLNPHGTDTGRLASQEHHFWCGINIQNQPSRPTEYVTGKEVKSTYVADEGFLFGEVDLKQAESRDTAYIVGSQRMIDAVTGTKDFHSVNASAFFGVPYEQIYNDTIGKTIDKKLRDLAKRVNHGANYCMGENVLVDTMGLKLIYEAAALLRLPKFWDAKKIAGYLLSRFHTAYPELQELFYPFVKQQVMTTQMLRGATGWTRYCFGNPDKNKRDLNAYVAHFAQSLNAMVLNKAYMRVFYEIALNPAYAPNFKLCAQIHDSILFQFREGHHYLCDMVRERMEIPVTVKSVVGPEYTFTVPADIKAGKNGTGVKYWCDTE